MAVEAGKRVKTNFVHEGLKEARGLWIFGIRHEIKDSLEGLMVQGPRK
jgi:hypothetical protein